MGEKYNWSAWRRITQEANCNGPAIYRIRLCDDSGNPISIQRFFGSDDDGLLCIGKTTNMERRRKNFKRGLEKGVGHSEANFLHILEKHTSLLAKYRTRQYEYSYCRVRESELDALEEKSIKKYVKEFGEPPPLNSNIPSRDGRW